MRLLSLVNHGRVSLAALTVALLAAHAEAQVVDLGYNITPSPIKQAGLISSDPSQGIVSARLEATRATQVRIAVHVLLVDDETRESFYQNFDPRAVLTRTQFGTKLQQPTHSDDALPLAESQQHIGTNSVVTTTRLKGKEIRHILETVNQSTLSKVTRTPVLVALNGKDAEYTDMSQHPFVAGINTNAQGQTPNIQVLDEGTRLRVNANVENQAAELPPMIHLRATIERYRIGDVQSKRIFGVGDEPATIQVASYHVHSAKGGAELVEGEGLLIDPYIKESVRVEKESKVPVFNKLPYLGRSFRNVSEESHDLNLMLVLTPQIQ